MDPAYCQKLLGREAKARNFATNVHDHCTAVAKCRAPVCMSLVCSALPCCHVVWFVSVFMAVFKHAPCRALLLGIFTGVLLMMLAAWGHLRTVQPAHAQPSMTGLKNHDAHLGLLATPLNESGTCFPESHSLRAAFLGSSHALPAAPVPFPKLRWAVTGHCPPDRSPALTAAMKAWVRHHHVVTTQRVHLHALVVQCSGRGDTCGGLGDRLKVRSSQ